MTPPHKRHDDHEGGEKRESMDCESCFTHPIMEERMEIIKEIPAILTWINQEKGSKNTIRLVVVVFLTGLITFAITTKSDLQKDQADFIAEMSARQTEHKLQMTERQNSYEQASRDRSAVIGMQVDTIKSTVEEIKTQTAIMVELSKQSTKQEAIDRDDNKQIIKRLEEQILFHRETEKVKK